MGEQPDRTGLSSKLSCLGPRSWCSQTQLSWGTFAYNQDSSPTEKNPTCLERYQSQVWTPPGTTRAHQTQVLQMSGLQKHSAWPSHKLEPGTENAEDFIVRVMLSELRNNFSFSFFETELRHFFLSFGTPHQMLIGNVTFTPHLQGDVYLKCNQGKASICQLSISSSDKSKTTCWSTDVV